MRITRLQIERFRSIKTLDFQVPQVCALVGPNNAGKSNILEAIKYREIMDRYPPSVYGISKVRRGRMAATDAEMVAPPALLEAIRWLGNAKEKVAAPSGSEREVQEWGVAASDEWPDEWVDHR